MYRLLAFLLFVPSHLIAQSPIVPTDGVRGVRIGLKSTPLKMVGGHDGFQIHQRLRPQAPLGHLATLLSICLSRETMEVWMAAYNYTNLWIGTREGKTQIWFGTKMVSDLTDGDDDNEWHEPLLFPWKKFRTPSWWLWMKHRVTTIPDVNIDFDLFGLV